MPGIGNVVPPPKDDFARRLKDLEDEVRALRTARSSQATNISGGGITIDEGGSVTVVDTDGHIVAIFGALPSPQYDRADGSVQPGVLFAREDGSHAFVLGDINPTVPPFVQPFQAIDRRGRVIFADSTATDGGLAVPYLSLGVPLDTDYTKWPQTNAGTWTQVAACAVQLQNPGMRWFIETVATDPTGVGRIRILVDGNVIATSPDNIGYVFAFWTGSYYWPPGWSFNSASEVIIEMILDSGAGAVASQTHQLTGVQV